VLEDRRVLPILVSELRGRKLLGRKWGDDPFGDRSGDGRLGRGDRPLGDPALEVGPLEFALALAREL